MTVVPSDLDIQEASVRNTLSDLHTCMPAEITAIRDGKDKRCFVDVLPQLQRSVINEDGEQIDEPYPVIPMVPVGYAQGGGFFVSLPLAVGDIVLLVFAERSLDSWIETAAKGKQTPVKPGDLSMHSLEGAIALPCGPAPRAALLTGVDPADLVVATASGTVLQRWKADGSVAIAGGSDAAALAAKVDAFISTLDGVFRTDWSPVAQDGGAALKLAYTGAFESAPGSVAAAKVKIT